ncbi:MAG: hypothetical protein EBS19_07095 [Spirochaetia bacterium]|nr:hypothetical protein [Spirochaetia bacterium]
MRPLFCMQLFAKYNPKTVLNCCSGWGGSLVASCALNVEKYIGIEINHHLKEPYENMISFLKIHLRMAALKNMPPANNTP